tara:strand:- start:56 stop:1117 length:1062 start_codon:yes stop_codon:yes gene_type:complete
MVNPIGGLDQLAKEIEFLEANNPGIMRVSEMGGSLQDFYTNRNLTGAATKGIPTSANTRMEIIPDNINFTEFAPLGYDELVPSAVQLAEIDQGLDQEGILGIDQTTANSNRDFYNKLFAEDLYTRLPENTGLRIDSDLVNKLRMNNPELAGSTDAQIMDQYSQFFQNVLPPGQTPKVGFGQRIKDFITGGGITGNIIRGIGSLIPKQDSRATAIKNYYGNVGLDNIGRIQSGLMAGYNPVSGGFLNMITGGRYGDPTRFGLQRAYQKRIDTIKKTLAKKESDVLTARLAELEAEKARELQALQTAQRAKDRADIDRAYREEIGDKYSGGERTTRVGGQNITTYDDPFDPGGGE